MALTKAQWLMLDILSQGPDAFSKVFQDLNNAPGMSMTVREAAEELYGLVAEGFVKEEEDKLPGLEDLVDMYRDLAAGLSGERYPLYYHLDESTFEMTDEGKREWSDERYGEYR
ncbi:MAG: hypothetical protein ABIJ56_01180 [Pseudomonadota bacterium]